MEDISCIIVSSVWIADTDTSIGDIDVMSYSNRNVLYCGFWSGISMYDQLADYVINNRDSEHLYSSRITLMNEVNLSSETGKYPASKI